MTQVLTRRAKEPGRYTFKRDGRTYTSAELAAMYGEFADKVVSPNGEQVLLSVEDGLSENDWDGWVAMNRALGGRMQLVLDDITCTNPLLLQKAIDLRAGNAILIKLNQIGTVSETIGTVGLAMANGWRTVISHRSGETEDAFIADLAVGLNAGQIKTGGPQRSERGAKYNRLLWIERELGARARFPGAGIFNYAAVHAEQFGAAV